LAELRCIGRFKTDDDTLTLERFAAQCAALVRAKGPTFSKAELSFFVGPREILVFAWEPDEKAALRDGRTLAETLQALFARCR